MKRTLIPSLLIGLFIAGLIGYLHAYGFLFRAEFAIFKMASQYSVIDRLVIGNSQYVIIAVLALGVAWATLVGAPRGWAWWLMGLLLAELLVLSWVFSLYGTFWQPLPALLSAVLSFVLAAAYYLITRGSRARLATSIFGTHLSNKQVERLIRGKFPFNATGSHHQATVIICDIANKHDLAEELPSDKMATLLDRFVRFATETFLEEGAYIHTADGEGVVALFGFPIEDARHAPLATRTTLRVLRKFGEMRKESPDLFGKSDLHFGLSSGTVVAARWENDHKVGIVPLGEPLELARRFCLANRVYGSRILMGPQTFEFSSDEALARPIDFLGGSNAQERFEIYELLSLIENTPAEEIARRDNFWSGVVYYRERRWGESYAEFQKAWGENGHDDGPLQLYLRRLEPLVLQLTQAPANDMLPSS